MAARRVLSLTTDDAETRAVSSSYGAAAVPVTLYTRSGCHLCEDALAVLTALAPDLGIAVQPVDVDRSATLRERYTDHVPVVCLGDVEVCRHMLDLPTLEQHLNAR